jgi:hypothetical protein
MKTFANAILLLLAVVLGGCSRGDGGSAKNLPVVVWSSFPPTNSYRHLEHLTNLVQKANALIATNPSALFGARGRMWFPSSLPKNSPLRELLGIPQGEAATVYWAASSDHSFITINSPHSIQRFGVIRTDIGETHVDSCYDVEALYSISEMEWRLRKVVGTRNKALNLFGGGLPKSPSPEQLQAKKAIAEALLLPIGAKVYITASAPGGSNRGQGYLTVFTSTTNGDSEDVAHVNYGSIGIMRGILSQIRLTSPNYGFSDLKLWSAWTNVNSRGFLLDTDGFPYPKTSSTNFETRTGGAN